VVINATGTQVKLIPGVLLGSPGGVLLHHDCPVGEKSEEPEASKQSVRSIGWYIEGILPLTPFMKDPLHIEFRGITDGCSHVDPSVDYLRVSALPLLQRFLQIAPASKKGLAAADAAWSGDGRRPPSLLVHQRGGAPTGGGRVELYTPTVDRGVLRGELPPLDWTDVGLVKRIRGTAVSTVVVSSSATARVAYAAKGLAHRLLPDVWIHTVVHTHQKHQCGPAPALSLVLTAETTTGVVYAAETSQSAGRELPEDVGIRGAALLLDQVRQGGCLDTGLQSLVLLLMCLTSEDVNRVRLGALSPYTVTSLRLFKQVWGVEFKITPHDASNTVVLSCLGTGYRNMARGST
jgi:RNA 3'-terminal phosphate cyclase-like protein